MRPHIHWLRHVSGGKQSGFRRFSGCEIHRQPVFPFCSIPSADIRLFDVLESGIISLRSSSRSIARRASVVKYSGINMLTVASSTAKTNSIVPSTERVIFLLICFISSPRPTAGDSRSPRPSQSAPCCLPRRAYCVCGAGFHRSLWFPPHRCSPRCE